MTREEWFAQLDAIPTDELLATLYHAAIYLRDRRAVQVTNAGSGLSAMCMTCFTANLSRAWEQAMEHVTFKYVNVDPTDQETL